ncbi:MAG: NAD-dependent epimerase/dehydratase family protein [Elusimicrobia bacterium]|nr:NAD-dependent epimerase/dehydratase family protein [Elusimicrobiota bacterium]
MEDNKTGFWKDKAVLVTGGAGFAGSHVVEELLRRDHTVRVTVADDLSSGRRENLRSVYKKVRFVRGDLRELENAMTACRGQSAVLHLAARVWGVEYNQKHPASMFRDNVLLAAQVLEAARSCEVERFLMTSSVCVYPREAAIPTPESEGFAGTPEPTNEGYGWAKRMGEFMARAYHREYGLKVAIVRPANAYGPRDHFESEHSHVISALIRRVARGEDPLKVWGDGSQTRSFLYVDDFARGIVDACERCAESEPINIGAPEEVSIRSLAETIVKLSGSKVRLEFEPSQPSGQARRACDTTRAREVLGFVPKVSLEEGLKKTIEWYKAKTKK